MATNRVNYQSSVYLITYSRADLEKVPDRATFARIVTDAFEEVQVAKVQHWVVSQEQHKETGANPNKTHYHMALKLNQRMRWSRVRQYLESHNEIRVNFSDNHNTYYSAYQYVTKEDDNYVLSESHPDLREPPSTEKAIAAKKSKGKSPRKVQKRDKRYSTYDVVEIIRQGTITTRLELINLAMSQRGQGKTKLAEFIANRGPKVVNEALDLAREFKEAPQHLARQRKTRLDLLMESYNSPCIPDCDGQWMECALDVLTRNEIAWVSFCNAVYNALQRGRGKYRNIYISGPANTGKTFLISPLKVIYHAFINPATGTFAWVGAEEAEVILLNDFRWHPSIIAWADFLQLLEGDTVHLPAPKSFSSRDIEFKKDTPFFATSDAPLVMIKGRSIDKANTDMMNVRWRFFNLWRQIPEEQQKHLPPCPRCFARFIVDYKGDVTTTPVTVHTDSAQS